MTDQAVLEALLAFCRQLCTRGIEKNPQLPALPEQTDNLDLQPLNALLQHILEAHQLAASMAQGKLDGSADRLNPLAMPLKALQANLRHLTWQTEQIVKGDLSQQVHFLGDFSQAYNAMIESLREKERLEKELVASEARLRTMTNALGEGVYVVNPQGKIEFMNPEAERLLGFRFSDIAGADVHPLLHGQSLDGTRRTLTSCKLCHAIAEGQEYIQGDDIVSSADGRTFPASLSAKPIKENGHYTGMVVAFHDISHQKQYQQSLVYINEILEKQALTDPLTEVNNRMSFTRQLQLESNKAKRYENHLSLIMFDVDHFKQINDNYGHLAGDQVLKDLARGVQLQIREVDFLARWGGEEFAILLQADLPQAEEIAEKLRQIIENTSFSVPQQITSSFGVTDFNRKDSPEAFTNRADQALYKAKHNGRNCVISLPATASPLP